VSRTIRFIVLVAVAACLFAVFATSAFAFENFYAPCFSCHGGAPTPIAVTVTPTAVTIPRAPTASAHRVPPSGPCLPATRASPTARGAAGTFTVPNRRPLHHLCGRRLAERRFSYGATPSRPPTFGTTTFIGDTTAPVSTSDAVASYTNLAEITITATDDSRTRRQVAWIYFRLNGGPIRTTPVGTTATPRRRPPDERRHDDYTLEFWAQDREGNIEDANTVTFSVTTDGWVSSNTPSTVTGPNGMSQWTYQRRVGLRRQA
jgi:hypothetical protein